MKKYLTLILILLTAVGVFSSCGKKEKKSKSGEQTTESQPIKSVAPAFDADSAFHFVKVQTDFGPRVPNTAAHDKCAVYLQQKLAKYADTLFVQPFSAKKYNGKTLYGRNIIGAFRPDETHRVILAAHWDSRHVADHDAKTANRTTPIDGANDGASGVGILLEIARQLSEKSPKIGVDIILFDVEDQGTPESETAPDGEWWCLGSQYWAARPHITGYNADYGILLDMVGDKNALFRHEYHSQIYALNVLTKVWSTAYKLGYGSRFVQQNSNPIIDDHYYVNEIAHIPMIDIIHQEDHTGTGFPLTWHTLNDNISNIDKNTLDMVGKTVLSVIYDEQ